MTAPYALGRRIEHDERSRGFAFRVAATRPKTVLWGHRAPVLDQGEVSSCTGNALAQWLNTEFAQRHAENPARILTEDDALKLYGQATRMDRVKGVYPPDDVGSSGLAVCKAGVLFGFLSRYEHVFGFDALLMALQHSPVIAGTAWTRGMFTPDFAGRLYPSGPVDGGHEYLILGCDMEKRMIEILNSWGDAWGAGGRAWIAFSDYAALLAEHGDVQVPIM